MENQNQNQKTLICIGDIHGHISKLRTLWRNLESLTPTFPTAIIIFLGDYCDRGPHTRHVIDFLLSLPSTYPNQTHVFLAGNHDFAFAAFVEAIEVGGGARDTWREYEASEEREGWYKGEGWEGMHLQGRRWGGEIKVTMNSVRGSEYMGSIYDAGPTFESYGVPHGSAGLLSPHSIF